MTTKVINQEIEYIIIQLRLLKIDNVVAKGVLKLADLGIVPTSIDAVVPAYLARYRPGGLFRK